MDGYEVMPMMDAAAIGDIFVSVTGCKDVITLEHCEHMKDGAIVSNAGHFNVEIDMEALNRCADEIYEARHNIDAYRLPNGKTIYVIAQGRLVNLAAGDGHPAEIMDMSFAVQAMSAKYLASCVRVLYPCLRRSTTASRAASSRPWAFRSIASAAARRSISTADL